MDFRPIREFQDRSIAWLLQSQDHMAALLELVVPEVAEHLEPGSLESQESTLIPESMRKMEEDVLYQGRVAEDGGPMAFLVLVAHQSARDRWMPLRFLQAMVRLWERDRRQWDEEGWSAAEQRLRPVVPILVHTGERPWSVPEFSSLFAGSDLFGRFIPRFEPEMLDLASITLEDLNSVQKPFSYLLRLYSAQYEASKFEDTLAEVLKGLEDVAKDRREYAAFVWFCIQFAFHRRPEQEWVRVLEQCSSVVSAEESQAMKQTLGESMADRIRREGRESGHAEGLAQGRENGLIIGREEGREQGREEGREQGREVGREEGREEGRELGLRAGLVKGLLAVMTVKFSSRPEHDMREKLASIQEVKRLEELLSRVLTVDTWEDLWSD